MGLKTFFGFSVFVALQGSAVQMTDQWLVANVLPEGAAGFSWVAFLAWATYFFAGCTIKGGVTSFLSFIAGIVTAIAIIMAGGVFSALGFFAFPAAIIIVVTLCMYLEKVPWFNSIPSVFIACGTFFGLMNYVPGATFLYSGAVILLYGGMGLVSGYISIWFRKKCEEFGKAAVTAGVSK